MSSNYINFSRFDNAFAIEIHPNNPIILQLNNFKDYHISNYNYLLFVLSKKNDLSINNLHDIDIINSMLNTYISLNQDNDLFDVIEPYELIPSSQENNTISYSQFKNKL